MGEIKVKIPDDVEEAFRENAMNTFGFGKGSISFAAEEAFKDWNETKKKSPIKKIDDPVKAITGLLKHVKKTSVELQHEAWSGVVDRYVNRR